jgi:hypothetical protein
MISKEIFRRRSLVSKRAYVLVAPRPELRGLQPVRVSASAAPKYLDGPGKAGERFSNVLGVAFGIAEIALGLFAVLCLVGLVAVGLFFRGR